MSFARTPPTPPASPGGDGALAHTSVEHPISANAEAWRRLAVMGYHRASEKVRAQQPATASHDEDDTDDSANAPSADAHQSGFQSL